MAFDHNDLSSMACDLIDAEERLTTVKQNITNSITDPDNLDKAITYGILKIDWQRVRLAKNIQYIR